MLPSPQTGRYCIGFVPLIEPTDNEVAETAKMTADALTAAGVFIEPDAFLTTFFPTLYAAYVGDAEEEEGAGEEDAPDVADLPKESTNRTTYAQLTRERMQL